MYQAKITDFIGLGLASSLIGGGIAWLLSNPGFESSICLLGGVGGLLPFIKNILDGKISNADKERIIRSLSVLTDESHYLLRKQNFETFHHYRQIKELRDFYRQKDDPKLILSDKIIEKHRQQTISAVSDFLGALGLYTTLIENDLYGLPPELLDKNPQLYRSNIDKINKAADIADVAIQDYVAFVKTKFPDLDLK